MLFVWYCKIVIIYRIFYKFFNSNTENSKLLCVVANEIQIKSVKNKEFKLFELGFKNNTLCYLNNLQNIIELYFGIEEL